MVVGGREDNNGGIWAGSGRYILGTRLKVHVGSHVCCVGLGRGVLVEEVEELEVVIGGECVFGHGV